MNQDFYVVIEKDEDGYFVGDVPALRGCYSQEKTIEELMQNMKEVIEMCQSHKLIKEKIYKCPSCATL